MLKSVGYKAGDPGKLAICSLLGTFQQALQPYISKCSNSFFDPESLLVTGAKIACLKMDVTLFWGIAITGEFFKCVTTGN